MVEIDAYGNFPQCGKKSGAFGGLWGHIISKTTTSFFKEEMIYLSCRESVSARFLLAFDLPTLLLPVLTTKSHNLKTYLASLTHKDGADPKTATYFVGRRFNSGGGGRPDYFNSGGAGYALSQATLREYIKNMDDKKHCAAAGRTSMEDVMIARCLSHLGISFTDTRDSQGRERFHPL